MKWNHIAAAVVTLGISAGTSALADPWFPRDSGREHMEREEHWHYERARIPHRVLETAESYGNGRRIDDVELIRGERRDEFIVHMSRYNKEPIALHIEPDGDLIRIDRM